MSLITPDFGLLFWMVVIFAILFLILAKFGFPVITGMVEKRSERIETSLRLAKEADEKIASLLDEQQKIIAETRREHDKILKEAAQAGENLIAQAKTKAEEEASRIMESARVHIEAEKADAIREIRSEAAVLSVKVAEKIIRRELSTDTEQMALVDRMIKESIKS